MELIDTIKKLCGESDEADATILAKIKAAIRNEMKPDFKNIKNGDHFVYRGIEFIRLGLEQGGVLCITAKIFKETAFNTENCNDWRKSSSRELLNSEFLAKLDKNDLCLYESDLTADNGDTAYGKCKDYVGLLSCDLYRKYRKHVPLINKWMWTCTPWHCGTPTSGTAFSVRLVNTDGTLYNDYAFSSYGLLPACIFHLE